MLDNLFQSVNYHLEFLFSLFISWRQLTFICLVSIRSIRPLAGIHRMAYLNWIYNSWQDKHPPLNPPTSVAWSTNSEQFSFIYFNHFSRFLFCSQERGTLPARQASSEKMWRKLIKNQFDFDCWLWVLSHPFLLTHLFVLDSPPGRMFNWHLVQCLTFLLHELNTICCCDVLFFYDFSIIQFFVSFSFGMSSWRYVVCSQKQIKLK